MSQYWTGMGGRESVARYVPIWRALWPPILVSFVILGVKGLLILVTPLRALAMTPWLIDDSFIFMRIARNLALGRGYSFDGIHATAGAPPLWTVLTSANHLLFGREMAAKVTVFQSAFFGAASLVLVFYLARRCFDTRVAWGAFAISALSAPMFFNAMNGMATSLFAFLGLLAVAVYLNIRAEARSGRRYFLLGCLLGLLNLTRADGVFLFGAIFVVDLFALVRTEPQQRRAHVSAVAALVVGTGLFTLPAAVWSLYASGSLVPANQVGRRYLAWEGALSLDGIIVWPLYLRKALENVPALFNLLSITIGSAFLGLVAVISGVIQKRARLLSQIIALYVATYVGTLIVYQGYFPDVHGLRYLTLPGFLLSILLAAVCSQLIPTDRGLTLIRQVLFAGVLVVLLASSAYRYRELVHDLSWTGGMRILPIYSDEHVDEWWAFLDWTSSHLPAGTAVAAKDYGRLAYFTDVRVVDLVGIIEPAVLEHLQQGTLESYLEQRHVEYVLLPPEGGRPIHNAIRDIFQLDRVEPASTQEATGYALYRILR